LFALLTFSAPYHNFKIKFAQQLATKHFNNRSSTCVEGVSGDNYCYNPLNADTLEMIEKKQRYVESRPLKPVVKVRQKIARLPLKTTAK